MRVLNILGRLDRGGVETTLVETLADLDRTKCEMDIMVHCKDPGSYDGEVRRLGAQVIVCPLSHNPLTYALRLRRTLLQYGPYDIVDSHVHFFSGFIAVIAKMCGVHTVIAYSHSDTSREKSVSSLARRVYESAMRMCILCFADGGLAVSREAGAALFGERWTPSPRWAVLHSGIDLDRYRIHADGRKARQALSIPDDALVVGHVGRFFVEKNHRFFVDIAQEIVRRRESVRFLLAGEGPLRPDIQRLVESRGLTKYFVFAGLRKDIPELMMGAMDVFLFPSIFEGLPKVILEAQAAGLRCLISDGITPEVDVVTGSVWRESLSKSAVQWADKLLEVSLLPRQSAVSSEMESRSISVSTTALVKFYEQFTNVPSLAL
jgi:glycosyltransferase involved in cell wall biosynthesis